MPHTYIPRADTH